MAEFEIGAIRPNGTVGGTFVRSTMAIDESVSSIMTWLDGNELTHEIGKATGETQVAGTKTTDGASTVTTAVLGTGMI
jgi:hypothetical protein